MSVNKVEFTITEAARYVQAQAANRKLCMSHKDKQSKEFIACAVQKFNLEYQDDNRFVRIKVPRGKALKEFEM